MRWEDKIAKYHDYFMQSENYAKDLAFIEYVIEKYALNIKKVLEIGCRTGEFVNSLKKKGYDVVGVDSSKGMINQAIKKYPRLKFIAKKMTKIGFEEKFDMIVCMRGAIHDLKSKRKIVKAFKKFNEHLRGNGVLILDVPHAEELFDTDKADVQNFDVGDIEGSIIKEYEEKNGKILFSYNVSIKDKEKIIRLVKTKKAPLLSIAEWKKLLRKTGFKPVVEYNDGNEVLVGFKI